ncbi:MAG: hypothetical protein ACPGSM_12825 [Thiolinea sp.]
MISDKSGLSSRLGWVLEETEHTLEKTRQAFADYSDGDEVSFLESALEQSRETLGILDLLEAEGAYMLNREVVLLMDAIRQDKVDSKEDAAKICADGLLQLSEYLKHLHDGYADLPVIVLPMLNNLRAARKAELLSEHLVFLPAEGAISNDQIGTEKYVNLPTEKRTEALKRLRFYMQKALLGWFNNDRPEFHLQATRKVAANMLVMNDNTRTRSLWWITSALLQGLEQKKLESSAAVKMLIGRMEREIRRFSDLDEESYNQSLPDELIKNLLYYAGLAERGGTQLDSVKDAYHLDLYLPKGETLEELRQYYAMPGRELWQSVAGSMQEELSLLMSQIESLRGRPDPAHLLGEISNRTRSIAQALGMLGLSTVAELTETQAEVQLEIAELPGEVELVVLERMSEHYIKLEKVLTEYAETGYDRTAEVFSGMDDMTDPAASREVVRSILSDVGKVQSEIALFTQETTDFKHVDEAAKTLRSISGSLDVLEHYELRPFAEGARSYLQQDLLHGHRQPNDTELEFLADIVTLLEAALSCIERQEDHLPLMATGYEKLTELDKLSEIDLVEQLDMETAHTELEAKKKARQLAPSTLYQKIRNQSLLATA